MRSNKRLLSILIVALMTGCGGGSSSTAPPPATLASISVTPLNGSISIGTTKQFAATGTYSDNSTKDLTTSVTWTSSDASVATISNAAVSNGNVVPVATGSTTITAVLGNFSDFTTLKVTAGGVVTGNNVLPITVNGSLCVDANSVGYLNKPCVSVTICNPGTLTCQTITDILLDTGSFGLRIFKQALTLVSLTTVTIGSGSLAECAQFGDGSALWGPVQMAGVTLASEPTVTVPIQVIDSTFANISTSATSTICPGAEPSPVVAGFNGILGVGVFTQDCPACTFIIPNTPIYYTCIGSACIGTTVTLSKQVQNPVALLPLDNNGVIVELPSVASGGASSVSGSLVLGIGTQTNNVVPSGVIAYAADQVGEIITTLSGVTYSAIIDSGSNGLFFTPPTAIAPQFPNCSSPNPSWFCPSSVVTVIAANAGVSSSPIGVSCEIGNFTSLINSNNKVFSNIGGRTPGLFDWGLPFYFGRNVYVGIEGKPPSSLGSGPYFGY